jgi:hypothetical protein
VKCNSEGFLQCEKASSRFQRSLRSRLYASLWNPKRKKLLILLTCWMNPQSFGNKKHLHSVCTLHKSALEYCANCTETCNNFPTEIKAVGHFKPTVCGNGRLLEIKSEALVRFLQVLVRRQ